MDKAEEFELKGHVDKAILEVEKILASGKVDVVLNFKEVSFISVDGLEWLEEILLRARSNLVRISFVDVPPPVYKVFKVAHIESLLEACGGIARSGPVC